MTKVFNAYAAYYDLLYQDKDYAKEADYIRSLLEQQGVATGAILELGSGTGKHAEQLALKGFDVFGVDISSAMVKDAHKRIPPNLKARLVFEIGDVRTVRFDKKFDAVISLFHVASYQTRNEDILSMFATAYHHLKSGGIFIFDFWYGPGVLRDPPAVRIKRLKDDDAEIMRIAEPVLHSNSNVVDVNYTVLVTERKTNIFSSICEQHSMRYFFLPELNHFLQSTQFDIVYQAEWMAGEMTENTWLGIVVAKKQ